MDRQEIFRQRLSRVIRWVFDGNVKRAADALELSQPTLHKILSGQIRESKSSTVTELADRLGVTEAWLRGDSDSPNPFSVSSGSGEGWPVWLELNRLYLIREQARLWQVIYKAGPPKTPEAQALIQVLEAHGGFLNGPTQQVLLAYAEAIERSGIRQPAEHMAAVVRTAAAAEIALIRLVAESLKEINRKAEKMPRRKASKDQRHGTRSDPS